MAHLDDFISQVHQWSEFYESVEVRVLAVENEGIWMNLHTDILLSAEELEKRSSPEMATPADFTVFHEIYDYEKVEEIFESISTNSMRIANTNIEFKTFEDKSDWKRGFRTRNGIADRNGEQWDSDHLDDWNQGIVASRFDSSFSGVMGTTLSQNLKRKLKQGDIPYRELEDLSTEYFPGLPRHQAEAVRLTAPRYVELASSNLGRNQLEIQYKTHTEIPTDDYELSLILEKENEPVCRSKIGLEHQSIEKKGFYNICNIKRELSEFTDSEIDTAWIHLHHTVHDLEPMEKSIRIDNKQISPRNPRKRILEENEAEGQADILTGLTDPDAEGSCPFGGDQLEYATVMLFKLTGFTTFVPEDNSTCIPQFDQSCDVIAISPTNRFIVCECTTSDTPRDVTGKNKISDAYNAAITIEKQLKHAEIVIPIVVTPEEVNSDMDQEYAEEWNVCLVDEPVLRELYGFLQDGATAERMFDRISSMTGPTIGGY